MMRKIVLAIVLATVSFAGFGAIGQHVTIGDVTFYYQIPDVGTFAVVSSVSLNEPGPVVIPAEIEGRPVRDIGSSAAWGFGSSELITSVTVPASVKNIRARTFEGCSALKTAVLPDSMDTIGDGAFAGCTALETVVLPNTLGTLGVNVFTGCSALKEVNFPRTLADVSIGMFSGCASLTKLPIHEGVEHIGAGAFSGCTSLKKIELPMKVTLVWDEAFSGCTALEDVTLQANVTWVGDKAFYGCTALKSVKFWGNEPGFGSFVFQPNPDCTIFVMNPYSTWGNEVWVPGNFCSIIVNYYHEFKYEIKDGEVTITGVDLKDAPGGYLKVADTIDGFPVTGIADNAFDADLNPGLKTVYTFLPPKGLKRIGKRAFNGCKDIGYLSIPEGVSEIGDGAFAGCTSLQLSVASRNANYRMYQWMLCDKALTKVLFCTDGYTELDLGDFNFREIGEGAFSSCPSLTSVYVPIGIPMIGPGAFNGCPQLEVTVDPDNTSFCMVDGLLCDKDVTTVISCPRAPEKLAIPSGVTAVVARAFYQCDTLKSVEIPSSVTTIGDLAFGSCTNLVGVSFKGNAPRMGADVFQGVAPDCSATVTSGSTGWNVTIPGVWQGIGIAYDASTLRLAVKANNAKYGTVSGTGDYAPGTKVTVKATPKSGYAFAGWFTDKACTKELNPKGYDNRKPTVKYAMPAKKTTVYAKFVTVAADKSGLKFSDSTKKRATTPKAYTANAKVSLALGFSSKSYPKVTASGLPDGLAIDSLTGKITGTVKKPGAYTVKVTVTSAAGNKITQNVKIDIKAPSWAYGTFCGYGAVIVKGKTVPVSATFTATAVGKVSGKVIYKGRTASFTASYASATDTESRFTVSFSADGAQFKSAMSIKQKTSGLTYTRAHALKADSFELELQKVVPLVQTGKSLEGMIGKSYTFKYGYANAGLTKSGDKLVVKFADKDVVKLSGIAGGKSFSGLSASVMACGKSKQDGTTKYKLNVPVVAGTVGYYRLLTFKVTIDTATKKVTKVEKAFAAIE